MRILLAFLIGLLAFFYLAEVITRFGRKFNLSKMSLPFRHSFIGLIFIILGTIISFAKNWQPEGTNILISSFLIGSGLGLIIHHLLSARFLFFEKVEKDFVLKHESGFERFLEVLPGTLTWLALTSPIWLSFALPFAVAYLILLADAYWLFNALKIGFLIFIGYHKMSWAKNQNWLEKLKEDYSGDWEKYYHLILIPTYKESVTVLTPSFDAIAGSNYPAKKIFLAVGFEDRDDPAKIAETKNYLKKYHGRIGGVFHTIHPAGIPGEVVGPGTNRNWMVKNALKELKNQGVKVENVLVTTLDADFVLSPQFLAGALYKYLETPENVRDKRTYTGVFLYNNNYWQAPAPMRLMAAGTAYWQLAEMVGSDKYMNFASMSISLKSLLDIGLWMPDKVNDDSGFYWKAYFHFKGNYQVIPHFLPISADAVQDVSLIKTFQSQYLQVRRWAYGVEHIPFIVRQYFKKEVDFWDKTDHLLFALWGYLKWGFLAIFVTFGSMLIPLINPNFKESVISINLPVVSSWMLTAAFFGLFTTIIVHEKTVPPRPKSWSLLQKIWSFVQWLLVPIIIVTISTLPAIDAQTSLMFGKKLEFRVTNKARLKA